VVLIWFEVGRTDSDSLDPTPSLEPPKPFKLSSWRQLERSRVSDPALQSVLGALRGDARTADDDIELLTVAFSSRYHWVERRRLGSSGSSATGWSLEPRAAVGGRRGWSLRFAKATHSAAQEVRGPGLARGVKRGKASLGRSRHWVTSKNFNNLVRRSAARLVEVIARCPRQRASSRVKVPTSNPVGSALSRVWVMNVFGVITMTRRSYGTLEAATLARGAVLVVQENHHGVDRRTDPDVAAITLADISRTRHAACVVRRDNRIRGDVVPHVQETRAAIRGASKRRCRRLDLRGRSSALGPPITRRKSSSTPRPLRIAMQSWITLSRHAVRIRTRSTIWVSFPRCSPLRSTGLVFAACVFGRDAKSRREEVHYALKCKRVGEVASSGVILGQHRVADFL